MAFIGLLASGSAAAQTQSVGRPKIGLALEGGSALGFAHIGVLEWLEANRVPVDYIAGTSMGGLVGGLYASGMGTGELRDVIRQVDWDATLAGELPFQQLSYRRKQDRLQYPNRLSMGLKDGLQLPGGLNGGHNIDLLLSRLTLPYTALNSFDTLPTPFRCVAVDMISGKEVVFDHGSLADALRATMSLPGIFVPARQGDRYFADGGILNNIPADVARKLGAEIVIGVHLATKPPDPKSIRNVVGVMGRTIGIIISSNELRSLQLADIVITVDLQDYSGMDFPKGMEIADKGHAAAAMKSGVLSRLSVSEDSWRVIQNGRKLRRLSSPSKIDFITISGAQPEEAQSIQASVEKVVLDKPLNTGELESRLTEIAGGGRYESLSYQLIRKDGAAGLELKAREKDYGPPFFQPAIEVDGRDQSDVGFVFNGRLTFMDLGSHGSELRTDLSFGSRYAIAMEYFRPFGPAHRYFLAPRAQAETGSFNVYGSESKVAEYRLREYLVGGDAGILLGQKAEIRAGYATGRFSGRLRTGSAVFPDFGIRSDAATIAFDYLGHDREVGPHSGSRIRGTVNYYPAFSNTPGFYQAFAGISAAAPLNPSRSIIYGAAGGTSFGEKHTGLRGFTLGGPFRLGAYGANELIGHSFYLGTLGLQQDIMKLPPLLGDRVFVTGLIQAGRVLGALGDHGMAGSATGVLVLQTLVGPLYIGGSLGDRGHRRWFFGIGRIY